MRSVCFDGLLLHDLRIFLIAIYSGPIVIAGEFTNNVSVFFGGSYFPTLCDLEMSSLNFVCVLMTLSTRLSVCRYACYLKTISSGALFRFIDS